MRADRMSDATILAVGIFALLALFALWAASSLAIPLLIALFAYLVLSPLVAWLCRLGLPKAAAIALIGLVALGGVGAGIWTLSEPAGTWVARIPESVTELRWKMRDVFESIRKIEEVSAKVSDIAGNDNAQEVVVQDNAVKQQLFAGTRQFLSGLAIVVVLTTFLLSDGGTLGRGLAGLLPSFGASRRALKISSTVRRELSHYLLTITIINSCLGVVAGLLLYWIGMPNPALWGAMMGLLNFIPFLGAAITGCAVFLVAVLTFNNPAEYVVPPLVILALNMVEGQFITPAFLAMRLQLSSVVVIISVIFWGWLWGVAGVLLAVPLLASFKIVCFHTPGLYPISRALSGRYLREP